MERLNGLWYGRILPIVLSTTPAPWTDPMKIVWGEDPGTRTGDVASYYGVGELFAMLQTVFLIICICSVLVSLIALLFVNKAEMVADKKANIIHKLGIALTVSSFATILTIVVQFIRAVFFMR